MPWNYKTHWGERLLAATLGFIIGFLLSAQSYRGSSEEIRLKRLEVADLQDKLDGLQREVMALRKATSAAPDLN